MNRRFSFLRMTRDEIGELIEMLLPIAVEQISISSIGMLISFFVRNSGMEAVASVNLLNSVNYLINQTFIAVGVGVSVVVAQYRGRGDARATGKVAQQGVMIAAIIATVVGSICLGGREIILKLMLKDSVPLIYEYSRAYLTYSLFALPFSSVYSVSSAAIRGSGNPRISMIAVFTYNGCYASLAFLSSTFTGSGLLGVSRSLLASYIIAASVAFTLLIRGNDHLRVEHLVVRFDKEVIKPMIRVSVPVLCENVLFSFGRLITQTFSVNYGTNPMAANGIVTNINAIMSVPIMAATNAAPPIVGRHCGSGDTEGAMRVSKQLIALVIIVQILISILGFSLLTPLSAIMTREPEVRAIIKQILRLQLLIMPVGFTLAFVTPAAMRSSGDTKFVLYVNVATMFTMRIGMAYILTQVLRVGVGGIWIGMYSDWAMRICFYLPRYLSGKWLRFSVLDKKEA